ncbi:G-protein coupled receptor dmsr-1-like [Anthonomus grandis grandis]|uniref:G-protein coupled receptor dmsr-1-like n=1 Tax=Anthonomus grandis grandis TaxID=2921223 RepID=UPI0021656A48|nr:G-protein coupled receptor dmsr-1-like [Anthonomus grandis grandis]XP_050312887.1 G-protein coupled receptor dmsr-1-like [Anthonomus grandis grandis]
MVSPNVTYCDLKQFSKDFRSCHIYLSFIICILGSILNVFNIFILSTKQMRSPTNFILTALATADVIVMLEYMPFAYLQDRSSSASFFSYNSATFVIFHAVFTNVFHFISCSLAIILAVWRYIAVKFPQNNQSWCDESRTRYTIVFTYFFCACVCVPLLVSMKINARNAFQCTNGTIYLNKTLISNWSDVKNITIYLTGYRNNIFRNISFYVYGIVLKLMPCILLVLLSILLVIELFKAKQRKKALMSNSKETRLLKKKTNQKHLDKEKQFNRTTKMLVAVLLLFLMAEFPQAMMGLLLHILGDVFAKECYGPLGDLLDIFTLTISAINFVLYCIMSQKFREVFRETFFPYLPCGKTVKNQWISLQTVNTVV